MKKILNKIYGNDGYIIFKNEKICKIIKEMVINDFSVKIDEKLEIENLETQVIKDISFEKIKNKYNRILSKNSAIEIQKLIKQELKIEEAYITDEEDLLYPNVYWRYVKQGDLSGVGPIHADKWFWDLNEYYLKDKFIRIKIWIPILENSYKSFVIFPGSHKKEYDYGFKVEESGKKKPIIKDEKISKKMINIKMEKNEFIIFNDKILHAGRALQNNRMSVEFTLAVKNV